MHKKIKYIPVNCFQQSLEFHCFSIDKIRSLFTLRLQTLNIAFVSTLGKARPILSLPKTRCPQHIFNKCFVPNDCNKFWNF